MTSLPDDIKNKILEVADNQDTPELYVKLAKMLCSELNDKYFRLVWLARRREEDKENPKILEKINEIITQYPEDAENLDGDESDWNHGFNSGVLATVRLIADILEPPKFEPEDDEEGDVPKPKDIISDILDEFPMLDS